MGAEAASRGAHPTGAAGITQKRLWAELPAPGFGCFLCCISAGVSLKTLSWHGAQPDDLLEATFNFFFFLNVMNFPKGMYYLLGFAYL